ncbi:HNH endonuclease [Fluviicoccus keumensis]|uniref:HNH endonuclease n=1 Tax=Fluviicoccus keumensis TaxID=1435465 RepID=A0A4Q7YNL6_9GAMM|nr:HNH endonuclease signature motif containing protein [Fluviicoccus keumensis]RZU38463.1 HNH endonuclease [Fluviicoccus keumensis]HEX5276102.1 HNH endonuclease signature motif containing protein [Fluviicoccus sp.]
MKRCFREPIPEILDAARYLDAAVSAHLEGEHEIASKLFALADSPKVRDWLESIWGKESPYVIINKLPLIEPAVKVEARMPTASQIADLHKRDGFHCRFCGIPVIRAEIRKMLVKLYPATVKWGRTNASQHAAFQTLWAQYDHVTPHSCGGTNDLENLVVTCAGCNFGKMSYQLVELGLQDPRDFPPVKSKWDGLERLLSHAPPS